MALCRGLNVGYGSVGPSEPRIHQVGENSPPITDRDRLRRIPALEPRAFLKNRPQAVALPVCALVECTDSHMAVFSFVLFAFPVRQLVRMIAAVSQGIKGEEAGYDT